MPDPLLPITLTHARLRRSQGDVRGAVRIVEALIDSGREDDEVWQLYLALGGARHRPHSEPRTAPVEGPCAASPGDLAEAFRDALGGSAGDRRVRRLERWLGRIRSQK